jgi:hypothetical protein
VPKDAQFFEFETYLKDRECKRETSSCPIEKAGTKAALDRCRMLADRIASDLREKKPEHFVTSCGSRNFRRPWSALPPYSNRTLTFAAKVSLRRE